MKIYLYKYADQYLLNIDEQIKILNKHEAKKFLLTYDLRPYCNDVAPDTFSAVNCELVAISDEQGLHIVNANIFREIFTFAYLTTEEFANKHNRKQSIVLRLCRNGRLEGAIQKNSVWLIPEDTPYPADARVGSRIQTFTKE